jgi:hypothetical protein
VAAFGLEEIMKKELIVAVRFTLITTVIFGVL